MVILSSICFNFRDPPVRLLNDSRFFDNFIFLSMGIFVVGGLNAILLYDTRRFTLTLEWNYNATTFVWVCFFSLQTFFSHLTDAGVVLGDDMRKNPLVYCSEKSLLAAWIVIISAFYCQSLAEFFLSPHPTLFPGIVAFVVVSPFNDTAIFKGSVYVFHSIPFHMHNIHTHTVTGAYTLTIYGWKWEEKKRKESRRL